MIIFKFLVGALMDRLNNARIYYRGVKNSKIVNNRGGVISGYTTLSCPANIEIGENSYVNGGEIIATPNTKIRIGDNCLISYNVHIRCDMHNYIDARKTIKSQGHSEANIIIGDDVWIGYGAQIMSGVRIADGCVIAAGAILTKDTEPYSVYAGVPARKIKSRLYYNDNKYEENSRE